MSESEFYTPTQRLLQDEFQTRALADRIAMAAVAEALSPAQIAFVETRNMFFLSTVDEQGFPSNSYKGGAPGFVRAPNATSIVFPSYDGNGMFMSVGNIQACNKVGLLFIDFETPHRLRLRGEAHIVREGSMLESFPGAQLAVEVKIERVWENCQRYIHNMQSTDVSPHLPAADGTAKLALWKRIDMIQDVLTDEERTMAQSRGLITAEDYASMVARGELG